MIDRVGIGGAPGASQELRRTLAELGSNADVVTLEPPDAFFVSLADWRSPRADLLHLDGRFQRQQDLGRSFALLLLEGDVEDSAALQVLTRYQRLLRPARPPDDTLALALACHRSLFDLSKPLVRADYDHALDTWRWLLRLDPQASSALQLAALFHDIERLVSEADIRREHLAPDYQQFKRAHAQGGAVLAERALLDAGIASQVAQRVRQLIERHETPSADEELAALNDADSLSFFSLNSWGFAEYFGAKHTRTKVAYTLNRMRGPAQRRLRGLRYHPMVERLLLEQLGGEMSSAADEQERSTGDSAMLRARSRVGGTPWTREAVRSRIRELGRWFHNLELAGVPTAPDHFLGDYPRAKWHGFEHAIPRDLKGASVLDVGCNAGFYAIEMKRRGADRVLGIDSSDVYLAQARFAAEVSGVEIELKQLSVYGVQALGERFDLVLFMGVLYHLRYPLLALDLLHEHVTKDLLVFQTLQRGAESPELELAADYPFEERAVFDHPTAPRAVFLEGSYAGDPTNWWIPNPACSMAMLRSAGFELLQRPEPEVYVCRRRELTSYERQARELPRIQP